MTDLKKDFIQSFGDLVESIKAASKTANILLAEDNLETILTEEDCSSIYTSLTAINKNLSFLNYRLIHAKNENFKSWSSSEGNFNLKFRFGPRTFKKDLNND